MFPLTVLVGRESVQFRNNPILTIMICSITSLLSPIFLLLRQWLGWRYILSRLISQKVEYEETGWYDGQIWEKSITSRQQDILIANHEVKPVIKNIEKLLARILILTCLSSAMILFNGSERT